MANKLLGPWGGKKMGRGEERLQVGCPYSPQVPPSSAGQRYRELGRQPFEFARAYACVPKPGAGGLPGYALSTSVVPFKGHQWMARLAVGGNSRE